MYSTIKITQNISKCITLNYRFKSFLLDIGHEMGITIILLEKNLLLRFLICAYAIKYIFIQQPLVRLYLKSPIIFISNFNVYNFL